MKRILIALLVLVSFMMVSCGGETSSKPTQSKKSSKGYMVGDVGDSHWLYFFDTTNEEGIGTFNLTQEQALKIKEAIAQKGFTAITETMVQRVEDEYNIKVIKDKKLLDIIIECFKSGGHLKVMDIKTMKTVGILFFSTKSNKFEFTTKGEKKLLDI